VFAAGKPHPLREPCLQILELVERYPSAFRTDAEVLQELLHRYRTSSELPAELAILSRFAALMDGRIEPLLAEDVLRAAALAPDYPRLSARDLVHLALMERLGVERMASADAGFDGIPWLARLDPLALDSWLASVGR
jgi:predicted nucleic acid-binding protein